MRPTAGFMQSALPVLHYAFRSPSLRNANHLKLMESNQVDGILPQKCSHEIFVNPQMLLMRQKQTAEWGREGRYRTGAWKSEMHLKFCHMKKDASCYWLSFLLLLNKGWKMVKHRKLLSKWAQRGHFAE